MAGAWQPPCIDLSPFLSSPSCSSTITAKKEAVAEALRHACQTDGIFLIPQKGWLRGGAEPILKAMAAFFALPQETKKAIPWVSEQGFTRGYIPLFGESGLKDTYMEGKEGFSYGYPWPNDNEKEDEGETKSNGSRKKENPLQGPNVWPPPHVLGQEWRKVLLDFYADLVQLSQALCRALSLALQQPEDYLVSLCGEGGDTISLLRAFHYFPLSSLPSTHQEATTHPPPSLLGSSPHTDWGFLTLILDGGLSGAGVGGEGGKKRGGGGGLQIKREEGWVDVPAEEGMLVCNCGDFLSLLSARVLDEKTQKEEEEANNSRLRPFHSPVHRVVLSKEQERTSLVFFYYPSFDTPLCGEGRGEGKGEKYNTLLMEETGSAVGGEKKVGVVVGGKPLTFGEHIMRKWAGVKSS